MPSINHEIQDLNAKLQEKIKTLLPNAGLLKSTIPGFNLSVRTHATSVEKCMYKPMVIIVLQGQKRTILGSQEFEYNENQVVVTSIDIPTAGRIVQASEERPFISLFMELDNLIIADLIAQTGQIHSKPSTQNGMAIADVNAELLDAFLRLTELLGETDEKQQILSPMIIREIHYLLLAGPLGDQMRMINTTGTQGHQIAQAISWIKNNFKNPLNVSELATTVHMSSSSFYRNFNRVTSLSPLQYQKQLRLHAAQQLMLSQDFDVASAAYSVGYESPTQFSREYKKMFGAPPRTNIKNIQTKIH